MHYLVHGGFIMSIVGVGFLLSGCAWHEDAASQALAAAESAQAAANQASAAAYQAAASAQQAQRTAASAQQTATQTATAQQAAYSLGPRD